MGGVLARACNEARGDVRGLALFVRPGNEAGIRQGEALIEVSTTRIDP